MRLKKKSLQRALVKASVFTALFVPWVPPLKPFHFSLLPCALAGMLSSFTFTQMLAMVGLVLLSYAGGIFSSMLYDLPLDIGFIWASFPIIVLLLSVFICSRIGFSGAALYRFLLFIGILLAGFVLLQLLYPNSGLAQLYVSEFRAEVWERYAIVMAPIGNPNNMALTLALVVISLQQLALRKVNLGMQVGFKPRYWSLSHRGFLWGLCLVLGIGIYFCYARTILAAFLVAESYFILARFRGKRRGRVLVLLLAWVVFAYLLLMVFSSERQRYYYGMILHPTQDAGFAMRYDYLWRNSWELVWNRPVLLVTGIGGYEGALREVQGEMARASSTIDSSYLYLLLAHGGFVMLGMIIMALYISWRNRALRPVMIILLISGITLAYLSDYRLNIVIGSLIGWFIGLKKQPLPSGASTHRADGSRRRTSLTGEPNMSGNRSR